MPFVCSLAIVRPILLIRVMLSVNTVSLVGRSSEFFILPFIFQCTTNIRNIIKLQEFKPAQRVRIADIPIQQLRRQLWCPIRDAQTEANLPSSCIGVGTENGEATGRQ